MNYNLDTDEGMANAVQWTTEHFAKLKDGGVWIVPRSGTLVRVNHTDKVPKWTMGARALMDNLKARGLI